MTKRLKTWLIHRLGGVTTQGNERIAWSTYHVGKLAALHDAKAFADSMNGTQADEWCKRMYDYILDKIKNQRI